MERSIYALHEGPVDWLGTTPGHVVLTVHAWQVERVNAAPIVAAGHLPIARMNNGYKPEGTIPWVDRYDAFAARLGMIAGNSPDVHLWIVGNEPNHPNEWPQGSRIYPDEYATCYLKCRLAIKRQPGHEGDLVLVAPVAPWCALVTYEGNARGDWVKYLADAIVAIGHPDGYALHAYTHTHDAKEVTAEPRMDPPFADRCFQLRAYRDFMAVIPPGAPVYVTECCPADSGWLNVNNGWVQAVYREIDEWNRAVRTQIRCVALYRGVPVDRWYFANKGSVRADWNQALAQGYGLPETPPTGGGGGKMETIWSTGFEDGNFPPYGGQSYLLVPQGWHPAWKPGEKPGPVRPEIQPEDKQRGDKGVHSGRYGVKLAHAYSFFDAALTRAFPATPGVRYMARGWCTAESGGGLGCQIGIASGEPLFTDASVRWSEWWGTDFPEFTPYTWLNLGTPAVVAAHEKITVYLRVTCRDAVQVNAGFWDDVTLLSDEGTQPPPVTGGTHRIRVYLDDALIVDDTFEAEVAGLTFRATAQAQGLRALVGRLIGR